MSSCMFDILAEAKTQEEFCDIAKRWMEKGKSEIEYIVMNICLAYNQQKTNEKHWTFHHMGKNADFN